MWTRKIANENVAEILEKIYHIQIVNIILSKHVIYKKQRMKHKNYSKFFNLMWIYIMKFSVKTESIFPFWDLL